eukprot:scaffold92411_cov69-Phaeocystis_antarctica.AAC.3
MKRKGIVKIALRKGAPLVPAYCFGHTELWTIVTDPLGILQASSLTLTRTLTFNPHPNLRPSSHPARPSP